MKNNYKKIISKVLIIGYGTLLGLYILGSIVTLIIRYSPKQESSIPEYSITELEKVYKLVEKREKLTGSMEVDLSKFRFGKTEPFR